MTYYEIQETKHEDQSYYKTVETVMTRPEIKTIEYWTDFNNIIEEYILHPRFGITGVILKDPKNIPNPDNPVDYKYHAFLNTQLRKYELWYDQKAYIKQLNFDMCDEIHELWQEHALSLFKIEYLN